MKTKNRSLDRIDLKILRCLQENARVSYVDLAAQVGLSTTPCLERVKRLELFLSTALKRARVAEAKAAAPWYPSKIKFAAHDPAFSAPSPRKNRLKDSQ